MVYGYDCENDVMCDPDTNGWGVLDVARDDVIGMAAYLGID
jgi:hypothetical protein